MCVQCTYSHECMCMSLMFRSAVPLNGRKWELGVNQLFGISWQTNQWNVERNSNNENNQFSNKCQQQQHHWAGKFCGIRAKLTTLNGGLPVAMPVRSLSERKRERQWQEWWWGWKCTRQLKQRHNMHEKGCKEEGNLTDFDCVLWNCWNRFNLNW